MSACTYSPEYYLSGFYGDGRSEQDRSPARSVVCLIISEGIDVHASVRFCNGELRSFGIMSSAVRETNHTGHKIFSDFDRCYHTPTRLGTHAVIGHFYFLSFMSGHMTVTRAISPMLTC